MSETREERWQFAEDGYDIVDMKTATQWGMTKDAAHPKKLLDYLNALEQERDELRTKAAAALEALKLVRSLTDPDGMSAAELESEGGELAVEVHEIVAHVYDSLIQEGK